MKVIEAVQALKKAEKTLNRTGNPEDMAVEQVRKDLEYLAEQTRDANPDIRTLGGDHL